MANVVGTLAAIADGLPLRMPTVARELRDGGLAVVVNYTHDYSRPVYALTDIGRLVLAAYQQGQRDGARD